MKKRHEYREGRGHKVSAEVLAREGEKLKKEGRFDAAGLVEAARLEDSPLHPEFANWGDAHEASENWYRHKAREWIADLVVVEGTGHAEKTEIALVSVMDSEGNRGWTDTVSALSNQETEAQLEREAIAILEGWLRRFSYLPGLAKVVSAIKRFLQRREAA